MHIDIPPHIEQMVIAQARAQNITVGELVTQWASREATPQGEVNPMVARALALPQSTCFDGHDAVALQRQWRDEWR